MIRILIIAFGSAITDAISSDRIKSLRLSEFRCADLLILPIEKWHNRGVFSFLRVFIYRFGCFPYLKWTVSKVYLR